MNYKINFTMNSDSTHNMIINFDKNQQEFSMDFFGNRRSESTKNYFEAITQFGKNKRIKMVKILIAGSLVTSLTWANFVDVLATSNRYNMSYLYTGTTAQQIEYVKNTNQSLNTVSPNFFTINNAGELVVENINTNFITTMHSLGIKVVPFISNHWDRKGGVNFLQNVQKHSIEIANIIKKYNLDGINVDIENVTHNEKESYTKFVSTLRSMIPNEKEVSVAVAANPRGFTVGWHGSYDYEQLAKYADHIFIMSYDEHYQGGGAGPVSSYEFVENSIKYALKYMSKDKIVVGIPFFGRVWNDKGNFNGNGIDLAQIETIISTYRGKIVYDDVSKSPKVEFNIKEGDKVLSIYGVKMTPGKYVIWFENEKSFKEKLSLVNKYDLKGAGSWALGKEKSSIWEHYSVWLNGVATPKPPSKNTFIPIQKPITYKATNNTSIVKPALLIVRRDASTNSKKITTLKKGTILTVTDIGTNGWYKVKLSNGKKGYVSGKYIRTLQMKQVKKNVSARKKASDKSKIMEKIKKNTKITIVSKGKKFTKIWRKNKSMYIENNSIK